MYNHFSSIFLNKKEAILHAIEKFEQKGEVIQAARNIVKSIEIEGEFFNVKRFKVPNLINQFAYRYVRKSKAARSFHHAEKLLSLGFETPRPVAYIEERSWGLGFSFYISEQADAEHTFRDLVLHELPYAQQMIQAYAHYHFQLHEAGILFLDNSPGNTLIKKQASGEFSCSIVDINRMKWNQSLGFTERMKNFCRLSCPKQLTEKIATEYALLAGYNEQKSRQEMWKHMKQFKRVYFRNRERKQKIKRLFRSR